MQTTHETDRTKRIFSGLSLLVACAFWLLITIYIAVFTYNSLQLDGWFTPDSIIYINAAENIRAGNGISSSMVDLYVLLDGQDPPPVPFTQWGPLYPLAIAFLSLFGWDTAALALAISALGMLGVFVAVAFLLRSFRAAEIAVVVGLLTLFDPLRNVALHAWSETLGLSFAILAMALALRARESAERGARLAAIAGVLAGLAFATRYALLPLPFVCALALWKPHDHRASARRVAVLIGSFAVVALPIIARNLFHTGTIGGAPLGTGRGSLVEGCRLATIVFGESIEMFVLTLPILLLFFFTANLKRNAFNNPRLIDIFGLRGNREAWIQTLWLAGMLVLWGVVYTAFLIVAQSRVRVDPIDVRLMLPATLSIVIALAVLGLRLNRPGPIIGWVAAFAMVGLSLEFNLMTTEAIRSVGAFPPWDRSRTVERSPSMSWLKEHATPQDFLIVEYGLDVPYHIGPIPTAFFSYERRPDRSVTHEALTETLSAIQADTAFDRVLIVLQAGPPDDPGADRGTFLESLAGGDNQAYPAFHHVDTLPDAVVWEWKQ